MTKIAPETPSVEPIASTAALNTAPETGKQRWKRVLLFVVYLLMLLEIGSRAFWAITFGVSFFRMQDIRDAFYPQLYNSGVLKEKLTAKDGYFDILMLGGSVLHNDFGKIEPLLRQELYRRAGGRARLWNVAFKGHTSRDSLLKFRRLTDKHFDLVIFYHGINEARMNNCSREMFKADYTHNAWYRCLDRIEAHPELGIFSLPWTIEYLLVQLLSSPAFGVYLPSNDVIPGTESLGEDIKSADSFRANLTEILELAKAQDERVLLMSFAHHIPPQPDPSLRRFPVTIWGSRNGVRSAINAHNAVVKELAEKLNHATYVDQHALIPQNYDMFDDPCHLTAEGSAKFVENFSEPLFRMIHRR